MEKYGSCPNCGRENLESSEFCKYCGNIIKLEANKIEPKKSKVYYSLFEYLKDNSSYITIAGVFAALTVYLIQFYNTFKVQTFFFNGTFISLNDQAINNQSQIISGINSSNFSFSANISYMKNIGPNIFGNLVPFLQSPPDLSLSMAVAICFSIFLFISMKIWLDILDIKTENETTFFQYLGGHFSRLFMQYSFALFIVIFALYILYEFASAAITLAIIWELIGGIILIYVIFKYLKEKSKFYLLDCLIISLFFMFIVDIAAIFLFYVIKDIFSFIFLGIGIIVSIIGIACGLIPNLKFVFNVFEECLFEWIQKFSRNRN